MTRPSTRYSHALDSPGTSLLSTPNMITTPLTRQFEGTSFTSTLALSPLPSLLDRDRRESSQREPIHLKDTPDTEENKQAQRLRLWRHDAIVQHQYAAAAFIGDKILARTNDPNDAFWLAQCYYNSGHYARARNLLARQALLDASVACRYLAAQCLIRMEKWTEALELLGEDNPFRSDSMYRGSTENVHNLDGGIKLEASMCYLRGKVFANINNFDRAKQCYQEALSIDVKCYDALEELLSNSLMTMEEEWTFLEGLPFFGLDNADMEFVKLMYSMQLNKYRAGDAFVKAESILQEKYGLTDNPDLLLSKGELLFTQCRFEDCLQYTKKILELDQYKLNALPLHLTCLHELGRKNDLFLLSHDMADRHPEEPVTWLAIGIYYMSIGKVAEARRHFSKASVMNSRFGAAWIGFAHSFAIEGEHDQAISAYTTASRLFQGTHLPALFLGMQHLHLNNVILADEYLSTAYNMCKSDPLLLNELGVVCFHKQQLHHAIEWFNKALEMARATGSQETAWVATHANLGHACRKLKLFDKARDHFAEVRRLAPLDSSSYAAIGLISLHQGYVDDALTNLHRALALAPGDALATELLSKALSDSASGTMSIGPANDDIDLQIDSLLLSIDDDSANASDYIGQEVHDDDDEEEEEEEEEDMDYE